MKHIFFTIKKLFLLTILLSLSSCFEILEEITLKKDGSGSASFTINMSQSKTKLKSIMLMDSINGYKVPDRNEIKKAILEIEEHLLSTPGISNVKKTEDYDNFIFSVSCNFSKIENMNDIALRAQKKYNKKGTKTIDTRGYKYDKNTKTFYRFYEYDARAKKEFTKLKSEDKEVFDNATYTCIYRFENQVVSKENKKSRVSKSNKAVMLRTNIMELINGSTMLNNKIKLTN